MIIVMNVFFLKELKELKEVKEVKEVILNGKNPN